MIVKIKNKTTGLYWYGFYQGVYSNVEYPDVEARRATYYDLSCPHEKSFVNGRIDKDLHEIIRIQEVV